MKIYSLTASEIIIRLVVSALLGSLVGWNRERKEGVAGLRTHMLVCVGSTLIMIVSAFGFEDILGRPNVVLDPSRIAAQVVSGIGFLGAGTILFLRQQVVRGLTTAAGLWSIAAVGLAVGSGMYVAAISATIIILIILAVIKPLEARVFKKENLRTILLTVDIKKAGLTEIDSVVRNKGLEIAEMVLHNNTGSVYEMKLTFENDSDKTAILSVIESLNSIAGVSHINLKW